MNHAEFFPGRSQQLGSTLCRGWLSPDGVQLVLPFSLVSVEPVQDRYSAKPQLWRDADGDCWLISYNQAQQEWIGHCLGSDLESAKDRAEKASQAYASSRTRAADRVLRSTAGKPLIEIWDDIESESAYIQNQELRAFGGDHLYVDVMFKDGSGVRVLHPAGISRTGHGLIEMLVP